MGVFDSIKGLFGGKTVDQLKDAADQNNDGKVDMADFNQVKDAADVNDDGSVNKDDLSAAKDKLTGQL